MTDATELVAVEDAVRAQWVRLRAWLGELTDDELAAPSVLAGWTVADLVSHVGRAIDGLTACQPADAGVRPQSFGQYISGYGDDAEAIATTTRALSAETSDDRLGAVDARVEQAVAHIGTLRTLGPDPVVVSRRGPIRLSDVLRTRLVELVVHGDDLLRSTERREDPVDPAALRLVAQALLDVVVGHGGWNLEVVDERAWVRLACGRAELDVDDLAAAIRDVHTAGSTPDLGTLLPLVR